MARRRKAPQDPPADLAVAEAEDLRVREFEALIADLKEQAAAEPPDDGVTVRSGDAAEDHLAYADHRDGLARGYGVQGPIEEMLLDRVAGLSWRLKRLQRVERGTIGVRAHHSRQQLKRNLEHTAAQEKAAMVGTKRSVLESDNPEVLAAAARQVRGLREQLESGTVPDPKEALKVLLEVFGPVAEGGALKGRGQLIGVLLWQLSRAQTHPDTEDAEAVRQAGQRMRAYVAAQLLEVERLIGAFEATVRRNARDFATAAVESRSWLKEDGIKSLVLYERHLQHELVGAVRELERAVARRRLGVLALAVGGAG